jgi:formate dehydrogenase maturation protein FdhE
MIEVFYIKFILLVKLLELIERKMSRWTKHADWQPLPKAVNEHLPVCPICKKRSKKDVYDRYGWTTRGYKILCSECGAEWEYITSKPQDLLFGGAFAALVA